MIFLSYKSEDANLVRLVAESLLAGGLDVWFNEYRILPDDYEGFEALIDDGLRRAEYGVLFTNHRWLAAKWCRYEMKGLLTSLRGGDRLVEVGIPWEADTRQAYPALLAQPPIIFEGNPSEPRSSEARRVAEEIATRFDLPLAVRPVAHPAVSPVWLPRFGVRFDAGPFRLSVRRTILFWGIALLSPTVELTYALRTLVFRRVVDGGTISFDVYVLNYESPLAAISITQSGASDDRAVYKSYLQYARRWLAEHRGAFGTVTHKAEGLHLIFVRGNSHFGLTYSSRLGWERRYAISIPRREGPGDGELGFLFSAADCPHRDLRRFSELSPSFDDVVRTVEVDEPGRVAQAFLLLPAIVARLTLAIVPSVLAWRAWSAPVSIASVAVFALAGYFVADVVHWCARATYRRLLATLEPALWDVLSPANPVRLLFGVPFHAVLWPALVGPLTLLFGALAALMQLALPVLAVAAWLLGRPSTITPEWTARRDLVLVVAAAALGALTNVTAIRLWIGRYVKRRDEEE